MPLLLNLNQIKAAKKVVFGVCKEYMGVKKVAPPIQGFSVNLSSVVEVIVRGNDKTRSPTPWSTLWST